MRSGGEGSWADGPEDGVRMEKHSEVAKVDGLDVRQNIGRNSKNTLNTIAEEMVLVEGGY